MKDKRCGNCKWRGKSIEAWKRERGLANRVPSGYFLCGRIEHEEDDTVWREQSPPPAYVKDGSGYYAALCVTTDFGCTEWESIISDTEPPKAT